MTWLVSSAPDQWEAMVRTGDLAEAEAVLDRYSAWADAVGQRWARAEAARGRAQLSAGRDAEPHFVAALDLHDGADDPYGRARTELAYGQWLRADRRRAEARDRLQAAVEGFDALGARLWAERAADELRAAGARPVRGAGRRNPVAALTPQELQVARLAAGGASNREIGAQLFLSPRTVGYHLYKIFPKLGIRSRAELAEFGL
ncbi:DNA-binding CsgD family transcriptional regulator [Catenulispora sp. GP43]|uniref:helix-turn-helix transcriptional regulator n=1 Tax=Catenulispora sp. GP43 TaxID=3156263 RepID=UPI0035174DFC